MHIRFAAACVAALLVSPPALAASVQVELNTVETADSRCRITFVIENKGGAGGYIAWQMVAASPNDGYTVLVAENALGINQALFKKHPSGFNPLKDYDAVGAMASTPLVWTVANNVPVNPLHARGFVSIGCAPCTRAVKAGEDPRAGRWWWENESGKECGLHVGPESKGKAA